MKRIAGLLLFVLMLTGCVGAEEELERVMKFRASLLSGMGCAFDTTITADYQDVSYTFQLKCRSDKNGNVSFSVLTPESISGITGSIDANGGQITFDGKALAFETLVDEQLSPITAPWLMMKVLRGGYITSCTNEDAKLRVSLSDGYEMDTLKSEVWLDEENHPVYMEFIWEERRILSIEVKDFEIL